jgi:hypothetical protein
MKSDEALQGNYEAVIADLETEREGVHRQVGTLQKQLRDLDNTLVTLKRKLDPSFSPPLKKVVQIGESRLPNSEVPENQKYMYIGVRWAILHVLGERGPMATAEIADVVFKRGVKTKAANFANNVSAMLTTTMRTYGSEEVESVSGKWQLTENGKNKLTKILASVEFLKSCPWAGAPVAMAATPR